ncbi:MAG: hypothetical protein AAF581_09235 [Planctomycetota bacterium]
MCDNKASDPGFEQRRQQVRDAVEPILEEGDTMLVGMDEGDVYADEADEWEGRPSPLRESNPDLYGRLARVSTQIDEVFGCGALGIAPAVLFVSLLVVDVICAGSEELATYSKSIGAIAYIGTFFIGFWISMAISQWFERRTFRRSRDELIRAIRSSGLSLNEVIAQTEGDNRLDEVTKELKRDRLVAVELGA